MIFDNSLETLANGLNVGVDEIKQWQKKLPVAPQIIHGLLGKGRIDFKKDETGQNICDWLIDRSETKTDAPLHESVHWLHAAVNPNYVSSTLNEAIKAKEERMLGISPYAILERLSGFEESSLQNLSVFEKKTGLAPLPIENLNEEEIKNLVKYRLEDVSWFQLQKLNDILGSESAAQALRFSETHITPSNSEGWYVPHILSDVVAIRLEKSALNLKSLQEIFSKAEIPLNTVITRVKLLAMAIDKLDTPELLTALENYYTVEPITTTIEARIAHNFLSNEIRQEIGHYDLENINPSQMEAIRKKFLETIQKKRAEFEKRNPADLRVMLEDLSNTQINKVDANTSLTVNAFLFFGDLPGDDEARLKLLKDPNYVAAIKKALFESEKSPLFAVIGHSPEQFMGNPAVSQDQIKNQSSRLFRNPSDIETAMFVKNESKLNLVTNNIGNRAALLEREYWDSKYFVLNLTRQKHPDWNETQIEKDADETLLKMAFNKNEEWFKDNIAESNLLYEPIAHVITNIIADTPINYGEGYLGFGGYDELLRLQDMSDPKSAIKEWHNRLTELVKRTKRDKKMDRLLEFFKANSLEEQKRVLDKYGGLVFSING